MGANGTAGQAATIRSPSDSTIGIIGLGYVGLPLAVEFGKKYRTIGFDIKQSRIDELDAGHDRTREVDATSSTGPTPASSPPAPTAPAASRWPNKPRRLAGIGYLR